MKRRSVVAAALAVLASAGARADPGKIELVYIGGRDCPWCAVWALEEKPRLLASPMFQRLTYVEIETRRLRDSYVSRYWPTHLLPILRRLPVKDGTPRFLILKDGVLYANHLGGWENVVPQLRQLTGSA